MRQQHTATRQKAWIPVIAIAAAVAVLVLVNYLAASGTNAALGKDPEAEAAAAERLSETAREKRAQPNYLEDPEGAKAYMDKLAASYSGNWDSLSDDDKSFLNGMTAGRGEQMLLGRVKALREKQKQNKGDRTGAEPTSQQ